MPAAITTKPIVGLSLGIIGSVIFLYTIRETEASPQIGLLVFSVFLMAAGAFFSYNALAGQNGKAKICFLIVITVMSLSINLLSTVRYETFSGLGSPDNLQEYFAAQTTLSRGSWENTTGLQLEGRENAYFSCLSVTIFPAILSDVVGLDLVNVFRIIFPIIFSLIPALVFLVIEQVFRKTEISALGAILYVEMFRFSAPQMIRQYIAILFLLLMLFVMFNKKMYLKSKILSALLFLLFEFGVISAHYTVAYFMILILLIMGLSLRFSSNARAALPYRTLLKSDMLVYTIAFAVSWLVAFNFNEFTKDLFVMRDSILTELGLKSYASLPISSLPGATSGSMVTAWYAVLTALTVVGLFYLLFKGKKETEVFLGLKLSALALFVFLFLADVAPVLNVWLVYNRVYSISLVIWIPFLAYAMFRIGGKWKVLLFVFLLVNLPMNMSLLNYGNFAIFAPAKSVSPELAISEVFVMKSELSMSEWSAQFIPFGQVVIMDSRTGISMFSVGALVLRRANYPNFDAESNYLALNSYNTEYQLWWEYDVSKISNLTEIASGANRIYDNGGSVMLAKYR